MVASVPSYKWLPLTYQLASRLGTTKAQQEQSHPRAPDGEAEDDDDDDGEAAATASRGARPGVTVTFSDVLLRLLWRLCAEHPHHSLLKVT